jgi:ADP-ribosylglycohydrolase
MSKKYPVLSGLMGVCVGDALGVPVEFTSRVERSINPVKTMIGYGTYNQPPGTWSDDSSLTFCLAEVLCQGFNLDKIAQAFCRWCEEGYWTPHGVVFDIGITTSNALDRIQKGVSPLLAGDDSEERNGNGSLMRILPMVYLHKTLDFPTLIQRVHECSAITHAHARSRMSCGIYISIAQALLEGLNPQEAYQEGLSKIKEIYGQEKYAEEMPHFARIFHGNLETLPVEKIQSGGYVLHSLEAALWCLLTSQSFAETVLKAVNLGKDTDTTAAITGGLAGIYYGIEKIPQEWIDTIARKHDIIDLANRLETAIYC